MWQPLIAWAAERYDVALNVTTGIVAVEQPSHALRPFRRVLEACDLFALTALAARRPPPDRWSSRWPWSKAASAAEQAADAALLDELFQAEKWGGDPEAERAPRRRSAAILPRHTIPTLSRL